ncbi:hypothetical protein EF294_03525 [Gordonia oryzae]|uniref:Uncharacterized protein n=1 Tax=Gordonia oryzae TaxID=2487349 RepID=A0A3N4GS66_9ACTN|nr:hypothetical protein [Gordonia oryzae]RPA65819.1 hypothetical protein EF294_03525 [Gordonia oryzae]
MVAVTSTKQTLAAYYATLGPYFGLATGSPGATATPANEASGGSYARVATTWSAGSGGVMNGSAVTVNAQAGTYTYAIMCSGASGNNMIDNVAITSTVLSAPGQIVLTPTYTQS